MKERVNIQYSIDIDQLPPETTRLLNRATKQLTLITTGVSAWNIQADEVMSLSTMSKIDELRQNIAELDYMLSDVHSLVASFINYKTKPAESEAPDPPADSMNMMTNGPDLTELQKKIDVFRRSMEPPEVIEPKHEIPS